jgi:pimeloyl-ACP methyl ester carboxylesterase
MLQGLSSCFEVCFVDQVGHSEAFPVTENWHQLVAEVVASVRSQATEPVIAVGHSLGGILSFRAAMEAPECFKAVILLDAPIISPFRSNLLRVSKSLGLVDHITPASQTRARRSQWGSREEVYAYLKGKKLFSTFTEGCLDDYVKYGMYQNEGKYCLRFDPKIEYQIYRTMPHILHQHEGQLKIPVALIHGENSRVVHPSDLRYMKKHHHITCQSIPGTHMFPMEYPGMVVDFIKRMVDQIL